MFGRKRISNLENELAELKERFKSYQDLITHHINYNADYFRKRLNDLCEESVEDIGALHKQIKVLEEKTTGLAEVLGLHSTTIGEHLLDHAMGEVNILIEEKAEKKNATRKR